MCCDITSLLPLREAQLWVIIRRRLRVWSRVRFRDITSHKVRPHSDAVNHNRLQNNVPFNGYVLNLFIEQLNSYHCHSVTSRQLPPRLPVCAGSKHVQRVTHSWTPLTLTIQFRFKKSQERKISWFVWGKHTLHFLHDNYYNFSVIIRSTVITCWFRNARASRFFHLSLSTVSQM